MADINQIITLAEFAPAVLIHEVDTYVQLIDLDAPPLGITVNIEYEGYPIIFHEGSYLTFHDGSHVVFHNVVANTPSLFEV